ncbi:MAG: ribose-5-phosphate isomerase RpiA [Caulobacteraceae bacterium]
MSGVDAQSEKRAAAEAAADLVEAGMVVGLGTGSTAAFFVKALSSRKLAVRCVATSKATRALAEELGLTVADLDEVRTLELTVDGADEIAPDLSLIKGGGGALLAEKLTWIASRRCVVIADASKRVKTLGAVPLPIEVTPFAHGLTARRLVALFGSLGLAPRLEIRGGEGEPFRTDSGNYIYDARLGEIAQPERLAAELDHVVGVVEHGLFLGLAERALIASGEEIEVLERKGGRRA